MTETKTTAGARTQVTVKEVLRTDYGVYVTAVCYKTSATVGITGHGVQVVCHNAANRCWGGSGRHFEDIHAASKGYKSPEMLAIINAADKLNS